ncbi:MAG: tryptophan synthase subunit alpha, partial [Polaromonas sp.]|nr:tryptophan synthase subunit alpha [Polaromonas sp.]
IGSKIIQLMENLPREQVVPVVCAFLHDMRKALDDR